jgi:hypothetical protein
MVGTSGALRVVPATTGTKARSWCYAIDEGTGW